MDNVQQLSLDNREAEGSNDEIGKDSETSNDQRGSDLQHDLAPDDWINDSHKHLSDTSCRFYSEYQSRFLGLLR